MFLFWLAKAQQQSYFYLFLWWVTWFKILVHVSLYSLHGLGKANNKPRSDSPVPVPMLERAKFVSGTNPSTIITPTIVYPPRVSTTYVIPFTPREVHHMFMNGCFWKPDCTESLPQLLLLFMILTFPTADVTRSDALNSFFIIICFSFTQFPKTQQDFLVLSFFLII